jgi:penicillin V acylase-like amidase (Ntn superfamily)
MGPKVIVRIPYLCLLFILIATSIFCTQAIGCTAAFLKHRNHHFLAANMDWTSGDGMIVVNKRHFSSVSDVVAHVSEIHIRPVSPENGVHFFVCDRSGDAAVIDIIDGKINVYQGDSLPVQAMANDPYASSLVYLRRIKGFGGPLPISDSNLSNDRFVRAVDGVRKFSSRNFSEAIDTAFDVLDAVSVKSHPRIVTQWQVDFDLKKNQIYYRTKSDSTRRNIDMGKLDFSCSDSIRIREIVSEVEIHSAAAFENYSYERNRHHVEALFRRHPLKPTEYENRVDRIARYPETFMCVSKISPNQAIRNSP